MSTPEGALYSRKNPFPATITVNRKLTAEGSRLQAERIEFDH